MKKLHSVDFACVCVDRLRSLNSAAVVIALSAYNHHRAPATHRAAHIRHHHYRVALPVCGGGNPVRSINRMSAR